MLKTEKDFSYSDLPEPHRERTKAILKSHPDVRSLISRNFKSLFLIIGIVSLQIIIAILLSGRQWWLALIAAYVIGAFANHALFVLIHECAHNLVLKGKTGNMIASIIADLANTIPAAISFRGYHLKHHAYQGNYDFDADLASRWEANITVVSS